MRWVGWEGAETGKGAWRAGPYCCPKRAGAPETTRQKTVRALAIAAPGRPDGPGIQKQSSY